VLYYLKLLLINWLGALLLWCSPPLNAQNINGIWKGSLQMEPGGCFATYNIELQIEVSGKKIKGISYHYTDTSNYVKERFEGEFTEGNIEFKEIEIVSFRVPSNCIPCIKKYELRYYKGYLNNLQEEQLRGSFSGLLNGTNTLCPSGAIILSRISKSEFTSATALRLIDDGEKTVKEIFVDTGLIQIDFYDNGNIDGDIISVYLNDSTAISHKAISDKPVSITVNITENNPVQELKMKGENSGSIPPNSALMIITSKKNRYSLYLNAHKTNASIVRLIYKKNQ
jgi:hypothetical protein